MGGMKTLDVRRLSCPQPALQTEQFLKKLTGGQVEVLVDSGTSRDNVVRLAQKAGWSVNIETKPGEGFSLVLSK